MLWAIFSIVGSYLTKNNGEEGEISAAQLEQFYAGDPDILARLFKFHAPAAVASVHNRLPRIDAEAIVQDAFVTLLGSEQQRRRFKGGNFGAYLSTMVRFRGIDAWRREQRYTDSEHATTEPRDTSSNPDARIEAKELLEKFLSRSVPPKQKDYFRLRFIEQRTQQEAASQLQIKRSTLATWEKTLAERLRKSVVSGEIAFVAQGEA